MNSIFFILSAATVLAVLGTLIAGVTVMAKGGETNKKYSNKLMQARVMLQGLAVIFFILGMMTV